MSAGFDHSLAWSDTGCVFSWGDGSYGKLGHGDVARRLTPILTFSFLSSSVKVTSVAAGALHSLAVDATGKAWGWGIGEDQTLGLGRWRDQLLPLQYPSLVLTN